MWNGLTKWVYKILKRFYNILKPKQKLFTVVLNKNGFYYSIKN